MICIYISILCAYMMLYLLSRREEGKNPFHKMAAYILGQKRRLLRKTQGRGRSPSKDVLRRQLEDKLRTLQPGVSASRQADEFSVSQYGTMLAAVFAGVLICSAVWWSAHGSPVLKEGGYIQRNTYGGGSIPVELAAEVNGEEELFQYVVEERKYTESQAEELYQKAADSLPEIIRGTNDSLEDVRHDLDLITHIDGFPFEVTWESSSYAIVDTDGRVNNEDLEESVIVTLTARFQYDPWSWEHPERRAAKPYRGISGSTAGEYREHRDHETAGQRGFTAYRVAADHTRQQRISFFAGIVGGRVYILEFRKRTGPADRTA